jgi:hypothetical protein
MKMFSPFILFGIGVGMAEACTGAQLTPGDSRSLMYDEGWLILAFDSAKQVESVDLCTPDFSNCSSTGPFRGPDDIKVLALSAGTWCISGMMFREGAIGGHFQAEEPSLCVTVSAAKANYPGHFQLAWQATNHGTDLFEAFLNPRPNRIEPVLRHDYPQVWSTLQASEYR